MAVLVLEHTSKKDSGYRFIESSAVSRISLMTFWEFHDSFTPGYILHFLARMCHSLWRIPWAFARAA
jgi:hypothetical protein